VKKGRASQTAISIAVNTVAASRDPVLRRLLADPDEPYSGWFVAEHSAEAGEQLTQWKTRPGSMGFWSQIMFPGGRNHIQLRKRWIEAQVRVALDGGIAQVVALGAGYDTLCLRLSSRYPKASFFELDHPDTQEVKRRALENHDALPANVTLVPMDFTRESAERRLIDTHGFRPGARGVWVAEGLLMYLDADDRDALFRLVTRTARKGSRFVFSMVDSRCLSDPANPVSRTIRMAAYAGEPIRSGQNPRSVGRFLSSRGFRVIARADHRALQADYLDPLGITLPLSEAEFLVTAELVKGSSP
jgi:methyltransferase (TIGR00027 family)